MSDLVKLKFKRGSFTRQLTLFSKFLTSKVDNVTIDDVHEVRSRMQRLENIIPSFEEVHFEIVSVDNDEAHETYRDDFENTYHELMQNARKFIRVNDPSVTTTMPTTAPNVNTNTENSSVNSSTLSIANVRLPKIDLPSFSGAYETWMYFYDSFKSMVHTKTNISNIEKLHYLRSCLKGEAATVIQSLETSEANYNIAWSLLTERYDHKRVIIQNHLKLLFEQPSCARHNASSIRQMLDNINTHTRALKVLGLPVDSWDTIIIYSMTAKLNKFTHEEWEKSITTKELPKLQQFLEFLQTRCQILEATNVESLNNKGNSQGSSKNQNNQTHSNSKKGTFAVTQKTEYSNFCKGPHKIYNCEQFLKMSETERSNAVKEQKLCFNCLRKRHTVEKCVCGPCKKCNGKHHTLLHFDKTNATIEKPSVSVNSLQTNNFNQVLLATAQIAFIGNHYKKQIARVLLESGSQPHFITERFAKLLNLKRKNVNIPITALNELKTSIKHSVQTKIMSMRDNYEATISFLVVPTITQPLPSQQIDSTYLKIPPNLMLADPTFYKSSHIDALIGAEIFFEILCLGQIQIENQLARLQKTKFGWIISGSINTSPVKQTKIACNFVSNALSQQLEKFWEIEETPETKFISCEEARVEEHFLKNATSDSTGKYVVKQPFKENINNLGESRPVALKRLYAIERKFQRDPTFKDQYSKFMREYLHLGHMSELSETNRDKKEYYLPHHAVIKETSATTKLRVVFDGSAKTSTNISLNETLMVGPTIQNDIFTILIRFRIHNYVLLADIEKMYRQVLIHEDDRKFQKILWRENPNEPVKTYSLNTVTYGTASAPFLAIRALQKLAEDENEKYPLTAQVVKYDFYVDNLMTGTDTLSNAIKLRNEIVDLLQLGGFKLRQWSSNESNIITSLPSDLKDLDLFSDPSKSIKTLGIQWNAQQDTLLYSTYNSNPEKRITKRSILSKIAQVFDPIGLLGPIIVVAKLIMQHLWQERIDWDESVPQEIHTRWINYKNQLPLLNKISFDRQILIKNSIDIQLHGFCDASEAAYGACIYLRSKNQNNDCITRLVCSKSRVSPLKSKLTIPKLELCAALLLAKLYKVVISLLPITLNKIHFWSDSTITLNWINTQPSALKIFVANRVSEIRSITSSSQWKHVSTNDNPADYLSRGQKISDFIKNDTWKFGPEWLVKDSSTWPISPIQRVPLSEVRKTISLKIALTDLSILERFSSFIKMIRVIAYCLRFKNKCLKVQYESNLLSVKKIQDSRNRVIKLVQNQCFAHEIHDLQNSNEESKSNSLKSLNPFLDKQNLLRVGGRIDNSELNFNQKHPILLPKNHHVTNLIIQYYHKIALHAGTQNTLYQIRTCYWILDGKNAVKRIINSCVKCFRFRRIDSDQWAIYQKIDWLNQDHF